MSSRKLNDKGSSFNSENIFGPKVGVGIAIIFIVIVTIVVSVVVVRKKRAKKRLKREREIKDVEMQLGNANDGYDNMGEINTKSEYPPLHESDFLRNSQKANAKTKAKTNLAKKGQAQSTKPLGTGRYTGESQVQDRVLFESSEYIFHTPENSSNESVSIDAGANTHAGPLSEYKGQQENIQNQNQNQNQNPKQGLSLFNIFKSKEPQPKTSRVSPIPKFMMPKGKKVTKSGLEDMKINSKQPASKRISNK